MGIPGTQGIGERRKLLKKVRKTQLGKEAVCTANAPEVVVLKEGDEVYALTKGGAFAKNTPSGSRGRALTAVADMRLMLMEAKLQKAQ
ncbi:hypothetical protein OESDEN_15408 [Oesophagostomum dentatum]|uniref:Uncharacterized protein n=1 Tax=Oesophagostomum dentatum TaxID=61180 RepID=A0A0B1SMV9_OESDE|nr:hypothetical protein OESDEN_15408 [Oesophagostomum dentatum]